MSVHSRCWRRTRRTRRIAGWTEHGPDTRTKTVSPWTSSLNRTSSRSCRKLTDIPTFGPLSKVLGKRTVAGTRAAVRTVIRYRNGVLNGRGASLLDGYMEDLATDRIYRLMIAQRILHHDRVAMVDEDGKKISHTPQFVSRLFEDELQKLLSDEKMLQAGSRDTYSRARVISESMIMNNEIDPS